MKPYVKMELPRKLKYFVDQVLDIDPSTPTCENCPHARAIKRKTQSTRVRVFGGRVSIVGKQDKHRYYYTAPTYVHQFEVARDMGGCASVKPGWAVIRFINRNPITPSPRREQVKANRQKRDAMLRAKGETPLPYRVRTGTALGNTPVQMVAA